MAKKSHADKSKTMETEEVINEQNQEMEEQVETQADALDEQGQTTAETARLQDELEVARAEANQYLEGWQRSRAEFSNYKRRIEREQSQVYQQAAGSVIKRYLDILDDMERALKNRPQDGNGAAWADGVELIYRKFLNILENEGVKRMDAEGKEFDPNLHEAVVSEENDQYESGQIIEVLQQGYLLGDRVLRPAMVRVAR
jgi:molecular chaperone GrpE